MRNPPHAGQFHPVSSLKGQGGNIDPVGADLPVLRRSGHPASARRHRARRRPWWWSVIALTRRAGAGPADPAPVGQDEDGVDDCPHCGDQKPMPQVSRPMMMPPKMPITSWEIPRPV